MVNETDIELIDAYLDDALSAEEVERMDRRLAEEPDFAAALGAIRTQRAIHTAVWMSTQPDESAAKQLAQNVVNTIRQRQTTRRLRRWMRFAGALAACVVFGFVAGWIGRGHTGPGEGPRTAASAVSHTNMTVDSSGVYQVALTDDNGNVLAVQRFARYEEAKQFADELSSYEARRRQIQQGRAVLVSDKF